MSYNEIIKALECCRDADCLNCPKWTGEWYSGMCNTFLQEVLDLINRQKAEIEKLNENIARTVQTAVLEEHALITPVIRYQAIKEFAEAVKMEFYREFDEIIPSIMADKIDNLVKEMTEGKQ